jgi:hypothetical protein
VPNSQRHRVVAAATRIDKALVAHTTQRRSRLDASGNTGLDLVQLDEALDVRSELPAVFRRSTGRVARILVLAIVWQVLGSL